MLHIPGLEEESSSDFPCKYLQAPEWGWSTEEADGLFERFDKWLYCDTFNKKSGMKLKRHGVAFAVDTNHSQVSSTYDNAYAHLDCVEGMDHCDGPTLPLKDAPDEILSLQKKLSIYSKRTINYLSIMKYDDETVGIDWHNHNEDFGIETPLLIISTGATRPFHLGIINNTKPKKPVQHWAKMAEHGSLIDIPSSFNDTHWHAILKEKYSCGVRISINTKCLVKPRVFSIKAGWKKYPRGGVYVGCRYAPGSKVVREGTIYGNDAKPLEGHRHPMAQTEEEFKLYAENKMFDDAFRARAIKDLRGKHLLCWCIQDGPGRTPFCHARVWLEIVNRSEYGPR